MNEDAYDWYQVDHGERPTWIPDDLPIATKLDNGGFGFGGKAYHIGDWAWGPIGAGTIVAVGVPRSSGVRPEPVPMVSSDLIDALLRVKG